MSKEVEVQALKPFNKTPQGDLCEVGEKMKVTESRAEQLEANRLARRIKAAPAAENKMAREPSNKAATGITSKSLPVAPEG